MATISALDSKKTTLTRTLLWRLTIVCFVALASATSRAQSTAVQIIPQPKQLSLTPELFHLNRDTRLVMADARSEDDRFAAQDFIADIKDTSSLKLSIRNSKGRCARLV